MKYLFKWSRHGHVMPFSEVRPKHPPQKKSENTGKVLMRCHKFEIFLPFSKFKMATFNNGYQADSELVTCISSVKYLFKWSCHSHIMPFFCSTTQAQTQKIEYTYFERREKCLRVLTECSFLFALFNFQNGDL